MAPVHDRQTALIVRVFNFPFPPAFLATFCFVLTFLHAQVSNAAESNDCKAYAPVTFGILPVVSTTQLVIRFSPLARYLSKNIGVPVRIETAPDFVEFARRTHENRRYDILYTAPHFFPLASSKAGYRLIASVDSPGMHAVIAVQKDSPIKTIHDLAGKKLATVHTTSLATLLVRRFLSANGIDPDTDLTMVPTPTHNASLLSSYHGVTDASSLMQPPYEAIGKQIRDGMRIIARTENAPHIPIAVSPRIDENCARKISELLIGMNETDEGKSVLKHVRFTGFKQGNPDEYEKIRNLLIQ